MVTGVRLVDDGVGLLRVVVFAEELLAPLRRERRVDGGDEEESPGLRVERRRPFVGRRLGGPLERRASPSPRSRRPAGTRRRPSARGTPARARPGRGTRGGAGPTSGACPSGARVTSGQPSAAGSIFFASAVICVSVCSKMRFPSARTSSALSSRKSPSWRRKSKSGRPAAKSPFERGRRSWARNLRVVHESCAGGGERACGARRVVLQRRVEEGADLIEEGGGLLRGLDRHLGPDARRVDQVRLRRGDHRGDLFQAIADSRELDPPPGRTGAPPSRRSC